MTDKGFSLVKKNIAYAFYKSLPVMAGYIFLGMAYGIVMAEAGFNFLWSLLVSVIVFAGSMQFVMVPLLAGGCSIVTMAVTALFVNCRHIFYGLSFVESFKKIKGRLYMIFALSDETYSVLCECKNEDQSEEKIGAWFFIALFDQLYWITGSVIGGLVGKMIPFDFTGIDFSMTALFVVILVEQILAGDRKTYILACGGLFISVACLLLLGAESFLLPSIILSVFAVVIVSRGNEDDKYRN